MPRRARRVEWWRGSLLREWRLILEAVRWPLHRLQQQSMIFGDAPGLAGHDHAVAGTQRVLAQALLDELLRRGAFDHPHLHDALVVGRLDFHEGVRVAPEKLFQLP